MRHRSLAGPLLLIVIGALFLTHNLRPELELFRLVAVYWPFLLIAWGLIRLLEVLARALRGRPIPASSITAGEVVLIIVISLGGSVMYAAHRYGPHLPHVRIGPLGPRALEILGERFEYPISEQAPAPGVKRIVLEIPRGSVRVTGGDGQEIRVAGQKAVRAFSQADADEVNSGTPFEIRLEGDRALVRLSPDRARHWRLVSAEVEITAPRAVSIEAKGGHAEIEVNGIAGGVDIEGAGGSVRLKEIGGDVRVHSIGSELVWVADAKGSLEIEGRGENIELENVAGEVTIRGRYPGALEFRNLARPLRFESRQTELTMAALPGEISMDLGHFRARDCVGPIRFKTRSRDVRFERFTNALELETERGDVELDPGRLPLAKMEVRARAGNIELVLPAGATFELDARAEHGEVQNEFGPELKSGSEGRASSLKGGVGQGPLLKLTTHRGQVEVRKAGLAETRL